MASGVVADEDPVFVKEADEMKNGVDGRRPPVVPVLQPLRLFVLCVL